ncbi:hypothetical protein [uncultured Hymenobacter sp.]|uniref:hypothetical protein n=1 Tax=uncultured Hymenobacter sp. TaxID=170016 RepID=UPI0035CC6EE1
MNIDKTPIPGFKAVNFFRRVKDELSREMEGKSFEEIKTILEQRREKAQAQEHSQTAASGKAA